MKFPLFPCKVYAFLLVSEENLPASSATIKKQLCVLLISKCLGLICLVNRINHLQREEKQQRMDSDIAKITKP